MLFRLALHVASETIAARTGTRNWRTEQRSITMQARLLTA